MPTYQLLVDTDSYAGNFERGLGAWLFGAVDESGVGEEFAALLSDDDRAALASLHDGSYGGALQSVRHGDDDWHCFAQIAPTPGYRNNGMGVHYPVDESTSPGGYAAYQSVLFVLDRPPTAEERLLIRERIGRFPAVYRSQEPRASAVEILGLRLIETVTSTRTTSIAI